MPSLQPKSSVHYCSHCNLFVSSLPLFSVSIQVCLIIFHIQNISFPYMLLFSYLPSYFVALLVFPLSETVFIFPKLSSQWHSFFNDSFNKNDNNNNNNRGNQQWRQQPSASFVTSSCCRTWREVLAGIVNSFGFLWNVCPSLGLGVRQARLGAERLGCCIWWGGRGSGGAV